MDYWGTAEAGAKFVQHLGCKDLDDAMTRLHVDIPYTVGGRYIGPAFDSGADMWGFRYVKADYGTGVYNEHANHPLARFTSVAEIEAEYPWPSADWYDYTRRILEAAGEGQVHITYVAEDMGSQEDLMFSPTQIRTFLLPGMKRMIDLAHRYGAYVFHHNDGACRKILTTMIEAGIDVLNPIQWRCAGMDREGLKRDFGTALVFHGAVDNQYTLPFGTVDEVRREVRDNIRMLGAGYILAPCHNIQAVGPVENIVAMYEAGYEFGWS